MILAKRPEVDRFLRSPDAGIRAAVALLEGKALHKHYDYNPPGWDLEKVKKYYRDDLSANVWWPSELSEEQLKEFYAKQ